MVVNRLFGLHSLRGYLALRFVVPALHWLSPTENFRGYSFSLFTTRMFVFSDYANSLWLLVLTRSCLFSFANATRPGESSRRRVFKNCRSVSPIRSMFERAHSTNQWLVTANQFARCENARTSCTQRTGITSQSGGWHHHPRAYCGMSHVHTCMCARACVTW